MYTDQLADPMSNPVLDTQTVADLSSHAWSCAWCFDCYAGLEGSVMLARTDAGEGAVLEQGVWSNVAVLTGHHKHSQLSAVCKTYLCTR